MLKEIKKRGGRVAKFDSSKITAAIAKAGSATEEFDKKEAKKMTLRVLTLAHELRLDPVPGVEEIQDIVERVLLDSPFYKTAKAYILYREQHAQIRKIATKANVDLVDTYIRKLDWKIKENSNMCYSLQGLNNYISSDITKEYWLNRIYPPEFRRAHKNGDFHIHDLSLLSIYCVGWDLEDILKQGFKGVEGKVESAAPKHLRSALGQIVNFFYTLQGEAAGAQAISSFDTLLAPFIRYDNLDYKEIKQALQEFVFNINIPTRVGFQTPFTNITMDLYVPSILKDRPVIIGGVEKDKTYSEFQPEMDMLNKAFAEVMMAGDAKGRVFTFPIPTYNITADFDWDNPNFESIWKMTGKYGIPYFSNFVNSDMSPEDARSMCCRLRLDKRELLKRGGGLFGANPLTGSIGVVTINLPRIGYLAQNEKDFFNRLKKIILLAKESLSIKRKVLEKFTDKNLYPYTKFYLREIKS
ncbi:MAG: ribonucleoside triphosphate reductase, partial [Thermodesulfobacteriota bacterium]|nr:ribonucleoside triphosphate reductase [Thermodesulfobacteriota bacterium]